MGQHQSLIAAGEESVGIVPTATTNSLSQQPCKDLESQEEGNGSNIEKGTDLSFRAAIDKFIESCLSNPQSSMGDMDCEGTKDTTQKGNKAVPEINCKASSVNKSVDRKLDCNADESLDKAKSFSSFLHLRIRDMIVNCENDDDMHVMDTPIDKNSSSSSTRPESISHLASSSSTTSSSNDPLHLEPKEPTAMKSNSVTSESSDVQHKQLGVMTSLPLQTLIDKVLDNSLGDPSVQKPIEHKPVLNSTDNKIKSNVSYEIAVDSAKVVSEKVARCVQRNSNNSENNATARSEEAGMCLMEHIEKVLERNFAQMSRGESESAIPLKILPQLTSTKSINESISDTSYQRPAIKTENSAVNKPLVRTHANSDNCHQRQTINPDGSISVQDIVDRVISQTDVISKLLTSGSHTPTATATSITVSASETLHHSNVSSQHQYERRIVKTINSSTTDSHPYYNERAQHNHTHHSGDLGQPSAKYYYPAAARECFSKQNRNSHSDDIPDKHLRQNQAMLREKNSYIKASNPYVTPEITDSHYLDHKLLSDAQRHKLVQENMLLLSRYPYPLHMGPGIDQSPVQSHHSMLRYCAPGSIVQQRMPPPLLRVDNGPDTGVSAIAHPYNKACHCIACCSQRSHFEELKRSPKPHVGNPNTMLSPNRSPHYQSRLSPHTKDSKHTTPHSPNRYPHTSTFLQVKDTLVMEKERERIHKLHNDELMHQRNRIEKGIDMLYSDQRRQPDIYEPVFGKNKYQPAIAHSRPVVNDVIKQPIHQFSPRSNAIVASDQPLDLTKKKTPIKEPLNTNTHQHINYSNWQNSGAELEHFHKKQYVPTTKSRTPEHRNHHSTSGYPAQDNYHVNGKEQYKYDHFPPRRQLSSPQKPDINRIQETSAAMTPGVMPEQLASPCGIRPQLHPLPSPNLSTSYTQSASSHSPHGTCILQVSPCSRSPESDKAGQLIGDSPRPPSQCSSSPFEQDKERRGSISRHEPIQNIIGAHPPNDILYLICRLCRQTYGSPYGFRKHFRNQHGFEPRAEHTIVQTISAIKTAMQHSPGMLNSPSLISHSPNTSQALYQPPADGSVCENVDMPKVRERAASESSLLKQGTYSETKSSRPTGSRSVESERTTIKEETDDTKYLQCEQCKQTFQLNDFGSYKRHCRQHNQIRSVGPFLGPAFQESQTLEEHVKPDADLLICKYCKIPYSNGAYLSEHMRNVHGQETPLNSSPCSHCDLSFMNDFDLIEHIRKVHSGKAPDKIKTELSIVKQEQSYVDVQPADQMTNVTFPDSSSDNPSVDTDCPTVSESSDIVSVKRNDSKHSSISDKKTTELCLSGGGSSRLQSGESSQDTTSSNNSDVGEDHFYKHKKFSGHRKRRGSVDMTAGLPKSSKMESTVVSDKVDNRVSCSSSSNTIENDKNCDSSLSTDIRTINECDNRDLEGRILDKHEARHQMPFVWDRITRSQAGKNIKPPDYMS